MNTTLTNTNRETLVSALLACPAELAQAEQDLLAAQRCLTTVKEHLEDAEGAALLSGAADAKNAEGRTAQVRQLTVPQREAVRLATERVNRASLTLRVTQANFSALRSGRAG
jgi:hypothetical protein